MNSDLVRKVTANMLAGKGMPVQLWVLAQFSRQPNGNSLISTVGMRDLGHMEIETDCARPLQEANDAVLRFAAFLIERQSPIPDGSNLKFAPDIGPRVRYDKSFRPDVAGQLYWLDFVPATRH